MDVSVISIGNSKGIRLTKTVLEKNNITDTLELILEKGYNIETKTRSPKRFGKIVQKNA